MIAHEKLVRCYDEENAWRWVDVVLAWHNRNTNGVVLVIDIGLDLKSMKTDERKDCVERASV